MTYMTHMSQGGNASGERNNAQKVFDACSDLHAAVMLAGSGGKGKTTLALSLQAGSQMPWNPQGTTTIRGDSSAQGCYLSSSNVDVNTTEGYDLVTDLMSTPLNRYLQIYSPYGVNNLSAITSGSDVDTLELDTLVNYRVNPLASPIRRIVGKTDSPYSDVFGSVGNATMERLTTSRLLLDNSNAVCAFAKLFLTQESLKRMARSSVIDQDTYESVSQGRLRLIDKISNDMLRAISRFMSESDNVANAERRFSWSILSALTADADFVVDDKFKADHLSTNNVSKNQGSLAAVDSQLQRALIELESVRDKLNASQNLSDRSDEQRHLDTLELKERILKSTVRSYESEKQRLSNSLDTLESTRSTQTSFAKFDSNKKMEFASLINDLLNDHPDALLDACIAQGIMPEIIDCNLDGLSTVGTMIDAVCEQFRVKEGSVSTIRTEESDRLAGFDARLVPDITEAYVITTTRNDFSMRTSMTGADIALAFMLFSTVRVGALNSAMTQNIKYGTTLKGGLPESILIAAQGLSDAAYTMRSRIFIETRDDFNVDTNGGSNIPNSPDRLDVASERLGSSTRIAFILKEKGVLDFRLKGFGEYQDIAFTEVRFNLEEDVYSNKAWRTVKGLDDLTSAPKLFDHQPVTSGKMINYEQKHAFNKDLVI